MNIIREEEIEEKQKALDKYYMKRALALAKKTYPAPNPQVGAVIVKNNQIIGEGYHVKQGEPHAEIIALKEAEKKGVLADGATMYVTLEPCCHFGKTPPCIDALIVAGIKRVVIGCIDNNPLVNGAGITGLVQAGLSAAIGICGKESKELYAHFFHVQKTKRSFVMLKSAMTIDGKIATAPFAKTIISCKESLQKAHELRRAHDAILVGVGTVLADDPELNCRISCERQPVPVIIDSRLRIPLRAKVLNNLNTIIATTKKYDKKKFALLKKKGFRFIVTDVADGKKVDIARVLRILPVLGILSVLVEGGSEINASFFDKKLVDKVCFFIAPIIFGNGVPLISEREKSEKEKNNRISLKYAKYKQVGSDICVEADVDYEN